MVPQQVLGQDQADTPQAAGQQVEAAVREGDRPRFAGGQVRRLQARHEPMSLAVGHLDITPAPSSRTTRAAFAAIPSTGRSTWLQASSGYSDAMTLASATTGALSLTTSSPGPAAWDRLETSSSRMRSTRPGPGRGPRTAR